MQQHRRLLQCLQEVSIVISLACIRSLMRYRAFAKALAAQVSCSGVCVCVCEEISDKQHEPSLAWHGTQLYKLLCRSSVCLLQPLRSVWTCALCRVNFLGLRHAQNPRPGAWAAGHGTCKETLLNYEVLPKCPTSSLPDSDSILGKTANALVAQLPTLCDQKCIASKTGLGYLGRYILLCKIVYFSWK